MRVVDTDDSEKVPVDWFEPADGRTLASQVAAALISLSLEHPEGAYLGAEADLLARFGISRPTLRQAAKIAEGEHMISVRRGTRGGFYAERPDISHALRALSRYLRQRGVALRDLAILASVTEEAAALAALTGSGEQRGRLAAMMAELEQLRTAREFIGFDIRFLRLLGEMSGNAVAEVVISLTYAFGMHEEGIHLYADEAQQGAMRRHLGAIAKAVLDQDGELARFMMRRRLAVIHNWIECADEAQFGPVGDAGIQK